MLFNIFFSAVLIFRSVKCDNPTVLPMERFKPIEDAQKLYDATGYDVFGVTFDTKEDAIINILVHRSLDQRLEIDRTYFNEHKHNLRFELKDRLKEDTRDVIDALITPRHEFYAKQLYNVYHSIKIGNKVTKNYEFDSVIEIFLSLSKDEIETVKAIYDEKQRNDLEQYIVALAPSAITRQLVHDFLKTERGNDSSLNKMIVIKFAILINEYRGYWARPESVFRKILMTQSFSDLRKVFERYESIRNNTLLENDIKSEFSHDPDAMDAYLAIVRYTRDKANYFARRLNETLSTSSPNKNTLTRIVLGRSEIDLGDISKAYKRDYGMYLFNAIKDATSGYYRTVLINLLSACFSLE